MPGVILYGPPAAGKDTITTALRKLDPRYIHFPRLKAGRGRTAGYRMTTHAALNQLRANGQIIWENHRYQAIYVVDRPTLFELLSDHVPVLHLGQVEAIDAVVRATPSTRWLVAYVWCPRNTARERILARNTGDTEARLRAWDETAPLPHAHLTINTADISADDAARTIHHSLVTMTDTSSHGPAAIRNV